MAISLASLDLQKFYPKELKIVRVTSSTDQQICIDMQSLTTEFTCPACHTVSHKHHGSYHRHVQDLPILGKTVWLDICAWDYECCSDDCKVGSTAEDFPDFLQHNKRMTERCAALICAIALNSSCEAAANICKRMGIRISGDSIIRLLLERAEHLPTPKIGDCIGVDDFAYRKGHTYCTVLVNGEDHKIVDILDGRDSDTMKSWLLAHKHIRRVTRDRASAYAEAISMILPDAMQVADRFHLHQNFMGCVKEILAGSLPSRLKVPEEGNTEKHDDESKPPPESPNEPGVSVHSMSEEDRRKRYQKIQDMKAAGYTYKEICLALRVSKRTVIKVMHCQGNIDMLCQTSYGSRWDSMQQEMIDGINRGLTGKEIYLELLEKHHNIGCRSTFYRYIAELAKFCGLKLVKWRHSPAPLPDGTTACSDFKCLKRTEVFQWIWENNPMSEHYQEYFRNKYPIVMELRRFVMEFREIFHWKNPSLLFLFIDKCRGSGCSKLAAFAKGLQSDIEAVLNAVVSDLSNGFVEGTNNKIKMVKRMMFGRCSIRLLKAKLIGCSI